MDILHLQHFPYRDIAAKTALACGIGLLVGLEREWSQKEIGVRTFAITSLLGMLTSLMLPSYVLGAMCGVLAMVIFLNVHSLLRDRSLELTTSVCLIVIFFLGVLVGTDHMFTAAVAAIFVIMLLAWKQELERFAGALTPEEIRSAVLMGMLSVVIYPLLPNRFIDRWQLINPNQAWTIVVVIAGIGFVNYALLRIYRTRGLYYAAVLGGLVNSTAAVSELSASFARRPEMERTAIGVLLLTNVAMFLRNVVILEIFAPPAVGVASLPLAVMSLLTVAVVWAGRKHNGATGDLKLSSPVSLKRVLKFGVLFLALSCAGTIAQRLFGSAGFLVVAAIGGVISSASTVATAAALVAAGQIDPATGGAAAVLTSVSSALINMPLVYQQTKQPHLTRNLAVISVVICLVGLVVMWLAVHFDWHISLLPTTVPSTMPATLPG